MDTDEDQQHALGVSIRAHSTSNSNPSTPQDQKQQHGRSSSNNVIVRLDGSPTLEDLERENRALLKAQQALVTDSQRSRRQIELLEAENKVARRSALESQMRVGGLELDLQQLAEHMSASPARLASMSVADLDNITGFRQPASGSGDESGFLFQTFNGCFNNDATTNDAASSSSSSVPVAGKNNNVVGGVSDTSLPPPANSPLPRRVLNSNSLILGTSPIPRAAVAAAAASSNGTDSKSPDPREQPPPLPPPSADQLEHSRSLLKSCTPEQFGGRVWETSDDVWTLKAELQTVWESRRRFDQLLKAALGQLRDAETELDERRRAAEASRAELAEERALRRGAEAEAQALDAKVQMLRGEQRQLQQQQLAVFERYCNSSASASASASACREIRGDGGNDSEFETPRPSMPPATQKHNGNNSNNIHISRQTTTIHNHHARERDLVDISNRNINHTVAAAAAASPPLNSDMASSKRERLLERELAMARRRESAWKQRHDELAAKLQNSTESLVERFADPLRTGGRLLRVGDTAAAASGGGGGGGVSDSDDHSVAPFLLSLASPTKARSSVATTAASLPMTAPLATTTMTIAEAEKTQAGNGNGGGVRRSNYTTPSSTPPESPTSPPLQQEGMTRAQSQPQVSAF